MHEPVSGSRSAESTEWSTRVPEQDAPPSQADAEGPPAQPDDGKRRGRSFLMELPALVLIAFVLALLLKTFLVQAFFIPSSSMEPTLAMQDRVLVDKVTYRLRDPARGDVIVFTTYDDVPDEAVGQTVEPGNPVGRALQSVTEAVGLSRPGERDFIKRIIGMPGETVEMREGVVLIDGEPLPEVTVAEGGYLAAHDETGYGPFEIPEDHYFMMGDNRPNSADSRFPDMGPIPADDVVGRAFVIIWPFDRFRLLGSHDYVTAASATSAWRPAETVTTGR